MAKKTDMTKMTDADLKTALAEARATMRELRFEVAGARPKDTNAPSKTRKNIARILTEQHKRALTK